MSNKLIQLLIAILIMLPTFACSGLEFEDLKKLIVKANTLAGERKLEQAIAIYDEIIISYKPSTTSTNMQKIVVSALHNKAHYTFKEKNNKEDAIASYNEIIELFGGSTDPFVQATAIHAYSSKCFLLEDIKEIDEAAACHDEVTKLLSSASDSNVQHQVAQTYYNQGIFYANNKVADKAIIYFDLAIKLSNTSTLLGYQLINAASLASKGKALYDQNKLDEAISYFDKVISKFSSSKNSDLQQLVQYSIKNKERAFAASAARNNQGVAE